MGDHRAILEQTLTSEMRKLEPRTSDVTISSDGQFAIYHVADRYNLRKLSKVAKDFLREGGEIGSVGQLLEG